MFDYRKEAEDIWNELEQYMIKRKVKELDYELVGNQTNGFIVFNFNLIKIMAILYMTFYEKSFESITEIETKEYFLKIPFEFIIATSITNLEVYLRIVFLDILSYIEYSKLNEKFKEMLHVDDQKLAKYLESNDKSYFPTREIIHADKLHLQNNENIKDYFKIVRMNIPQIIKSFDQTLWGKLFSKEDNNLGYLKLRNNLIHKGSVYARTYLRNIDMSYINSLILDITKFIFAIENYLTEKFPKKEGYGRIYYG